MPTLIGILLARAKRSQSGALVGVAAVMVLAGALAFSMTQHVGYGTALYWAITTATTVGYGDVTPHNTAGRVVAVAVMLTAIPLFGAAFAFLSASLTSARLAKLLHVRESAPKGDFVAIYGMHAAVRRLVVEVCAAGDRVVVVAEGELGHLPSGVSVIHGDPTLEPVLIQSEPARASRLLVAVEDDKDALLIAVMLRHLAPDVPIIAVAGSARIAAALSDLGVSATLSVEDLLGHTLAKSIETPHAGDLLLEMVGSPDLFFQELAVTGEAVGKPLSAVRSEEQGLVLGAVRSGRVDMGLGADPILEAGDLLLLLRRSKAGG